MKSRKKVELRSDQLLPHSVEAEEAVLGSILVNPDCLDEVLQHMSPGDCFIVRHEWIMEAMLSLVEQGIGIDHLTVSQELESRGKLADTGGFVYLVALINKTPSSLNAGGYAKLVSRMAYRRNLIYACQDIARLAHSDETDISEIHDRATERFNRVGGRAILTYHSARALFGGFVDVMIQRARDAQNGRPHVGLSTDIPEWDVIFDGDFGPGAYSIVFGPTGIGKSFALVQMALAAAKQGMPVVYITLENLDDSIRDRMVAVESGVPLTVIRTAMWNGKPIPSDMLTRTLEISASMDHLPLEVVSHLNTSQEIGDHLKAATIRHGRPGICFVDTLNELADAAKKDSRYENLTKASALMLQIMRRTGWGIVSAAQMGLKLDAGMSWDTAKDAAFPTKHSLEGARTIVQHVANLIGVYSSDYIAKEIHDDNYFDDECPRGQVLFVKVKGRDTRPDLDGLVRWHPGIPRFESKSTPPAGAMVARAGGLVPQWSRDDDLIDMEVG